MIDLPLWCWESHRQHSRQPYDEKTGYAKSEQANKQAAQLTICNKVQAKQDDTYSKAQADKK